MNTENVLSQIRSYGLSLPPDQVRAMLERHEAGVRAAKERFEGWGGWELVSRKDARQPFTIYQNGEYFVGVAQVDTGHAYFGVVTYLLCLRRDGEPSHSWLDFQQIKNTLAGEDEIALEVYPPQSRLLDTVNAYHLWVLPGRGRDFPLDLTVLYKNRKLSR